MRDRELGAILPSGVVALASFIGLAIGSPALGSPSWFLPVGLAAAAYLAAMFVLFPSRTNLPRRTVVLCLAFAALFRVPLWATGPGRDVYRYAWDARVAGAGYNPYFVTPSDPSLAWLHTEETRRIDHPDLATPYPPGAQWFFRLVHLFSARAYAFKAALAVCDVLVAVVLWLWLAPRRELFWLLAYAWNPLVILVTAGEAHVDMAGALCLVASVTLLSARHRLASALCLGLAVTIKPIPVVLLPLYWRRVRVLDVVAAAVLVTLLCLPYLHGWRLPVGSLGVFIDSFRFNGPVFGAASVLLGPRGAAATAVAAGLATATLVRATSGRCRSVAAGSRPFAGGPPLSNDPIGPLGAWTWPMTVALLASPVVYPWYLVWLLPFVTGLDAVPVLAWSLGILGTYRVWDLAQHGARWAVPPGILLLEFGVVALAAVLVAWRHRRVGSDLDPRFRPRGGVK